MPNVLLAVSGGVDSIVLLHQMVAKGLDVGVAHVHHGQRRASDEEYRFVEQLAREYGVPFHGKRLIIETASQAAYREARYAFFETVMQECGYRELMTAHHADDVVETVLIQLHRNVVEVTGIPERRPFGGGVLVRPLLDETKQSLIAYARQHDLEWREDATNAKTDYLRNRMRHLVIPPLRAGWPTLVRDVCATARANRRTWQRRYAAMTVWMDRHVDLEMKAFHVKLEAVMVLSAEERYVLGRLLSERFGVQVAEGMTRLMQSKRGTGVYDVGGDFRLEKRDGGIALTERGQLSIPSPQRVETLPTRVTFGEHVVSLEVTEDGRGFPLDALEWPLYVRSPRPGDRISLSVGTKKVARVLIDAKVPREKRPFIPLLVDATGRIIAIVGIRVSDFPEKSDARCPRLMVKW
ncbi:tRNA lysidine(34) synthetase TilS [Exiguobacterium aurantiacum]|uniref:tRNA(Ile)-lysidine synthase n=1 Tax=Exiguobacterium aurantiacum TaxID=33987 RepID=A0A377FQC3_9BACL|nr:tRNA lysidine(34) synthetase TilS [Exiguobacterium aurantiacum]STO06764.1 tRNA(Ile)-lysidine synthase [Exiguobacterium aurantiacum]